MNRPAFLIDKVEIRNQFARLRKVDGRGCGQIGGGARLGDGDVFQIVVIGHDKGCLHGVAGMHDVEDPGIAHGEWHGHGLHVSGDLVMVEREGVGGGIDGDNAALDGETAFAAGGLLSLAAEDAKQQKNRENNAYAQGAPPRTV